MSKIESMNQSKNQDKSSVDISPKDSANTSKVAGTTIRQLCAKIIYRKVYAEKMIVLRDIQNLVKSRGLVITMIASAALFQREY